MNSATTRAVYGYDDLHRLINPRVVAVVGASETRGSFGERTLSNMSDFTGEVFAINPEIPELARPALCAFAFGSAEEPRLRGAVRCAANGRGHDRECRHRYSGRRDCLCLGFCGNRKA